MSRKESRKYKVVDKIGDLIIERAEPINPVEKLIGGKVRIRRGKRAVAEA